MPDLAVKVRPLVMYCLHNWLPGLHLLLGPDAGGVGVPGVQGQVEIQVCKEQGPKRTTSYQS
jgi:hypothetical protein